MNHVHDPAPRDPGDVDPELERRLAAALRSTFALEPTSDDDAARLRALLASAESAGASPPASTVTVMAGRTRRRSRPGRTGLLVAAAIATVALIGVSTSVWSTATPDRTPATAPSGPTTPSADGTTRLPIGVASSTAPTSADAEVAPPTTTGTGDEPVSTGQVAVTLTGPVASTSGAGEPPPSVDPPPSVEAPPSTDALAPTSSVEPQTAVTAADPLDYRVDDTRYEVPGMIEFRSPSANIYCVMADQGVPGADCQAFEADFATRTCPDETGATDLGMVVSVHGAGETSDGSRTAADPVGRYSEACGYGLVATAGAPPASARVLDYGRSLTYSGFSCVSETTGVTCRNDVSGAGFSVSRAAYRLF